MLRQEVLKLYREVLRTAKDLDPNQKTEIVQWAKADFQQNRSQTNEVRMNKGNHFNQIVAMY